MQSWSNAADADEELVGKKTTSYSVQSSQWFSARLEGSFKLAPHTAVLGCVLFNIFITDMDDRIVNILTRNRRTSGVVISI